MSQVAASGEAQEAMVSRGVPQVAQPQFVTPIVVSRPASGRRSFLPRPPTARPTRVPAITYIVDPEPQLGESFHEHLARQPPPSGGDRLRVDGGRSEGGGQIYQQGSQVVRSTQEKAVKAVQSLAHKKNAEKKAAMASIRKRQEEAREKHSQAREKAARITKAKEQLKLIGEGIKIDEVLALIREENRDIEEAVGARGASAAGGARGGRARLAAAALRRTAAPDSPIASAQRAALAELAERMPVSREEAILEPEAVVRVILAPEIVEPPLNTSLQVAEDQVGKAEGTAAEETVRSVETPQTDSAQPEPNAAQEKTDEEMMRGYATLFGGEREMSLYMKETAERTRAWLENVTLDSSMLLDESDVGAPEEFIEGLERQRAEAERHREAARREPEIRVQLRGSQPPGWFPGYFTVLPQAAPPRLLLARSPSRCVAAAWRECRPERYGEDDSVLIH